jgi:hypothetical protein
MIEFMESEGDIDLWALRQSHPVLFELVRLEPRDDGKGDITLWRLRPECRDFVGARARRN